jgi:selenocysteine-specific elongation factor
MNHLILGTAGHVDHGKTALVKALTGIDCDTHEEEKRRGITINLGFAHLALPSGDTVGIIDVPGHRDFITTMVGGASGIDIALLVVAADSGIMPQTREHLRIMEVLGIKNGIVALTRIDLADCATIDCAVEELRELTAGTFLENCPVVKVSPVTGVGIDELKKVIADIACKVRDRPVREVFRMYIDRIFSVSGFGTVVTGSVIGGSLCAGSPAWLMPDGRELRVRRIERYGHEVKQVFAGDRASLNLAGLSRDEFVRGMLVSDRVLRTTTMVDARFRLFEAARPLERWSRALYLQGTGEAQARIHLLDCDTLTQGKEALVQIHLSRPCVAQWGDRFVLRSTSGDRTIGGGAVIDATPLHHRRRPRALIEGLRQLAGGGSAELIAAEVRKHPVGAGAPVLAAQLNLSLAEIGETTPRLPPDIRSIPGHKPEEPRRLIHKDAFDDIVKMIDGILTRHHRENPLADEGKTAEELLGLLGLEQSADSAQGLRSILAQMSNNRALKQVRHTWALASHSVAVSGDLDKQVTLVDEMLRVSGMKTPLMADLVAFAKNHGFDERVLRQVLAYLVNCRRAYAVEGSFIHAAVVDSCRKKLLDKLVVTPEGLTVAAFRDLVGGNRKICLLLYALFDNEKITERRGDVRVITEKGKTNSSQAQV